MKLSIEFVEYSLIFLEKSWFWLRDDEIKHLTLTPDFTREQQMNFYNSLSDKKDYFIKGIESNGMPIGACGLKKINNYDAEYWGYIGEKKYWGQGIGKEMMNYIISITKKKHLKSIYLSVSRSNIRAQKLYEKNGFVIERINDDIIKMRLIL